MRRYRTGQTAKKQVIREIKQTGLLTIAAVFGGALLLFIAFQLFRFAGGNDRSAAQEYFTIAQTYKAEQNFRDAKAQLKKAVAEDQSWPEARIALADVSLSLFDAVTAKNELLAAKKLNAAPAKVDHLLGKAHWLLGEYDAAKEALSNPDIAEQDYPDAQRILGRVLIETGDVDGSRAAFDRALEKSPENSMIWTDIARFRYILGDQKAAIEAADYAVELDGDNIRALEFRGRMVRSQFGLVAAIPWFERALAINPGDISIMTEYAATLGDAGRATDMLRVARDILEIEPQNGNAYYMQAVIAARAREYGLARRLLSLAGERQNNLPAGLLLSATVEFELENYNQSILLFRKLIQAQPNNAKALKLLASAQYRAGQFEAAYESILRYMTKHGADSYSNVIAARSLESMDNRNEAAKYLDKLIYAQNDIITLVKEEEQFDILQNKATQNPNRADLVIPYIRALLSRGNNAAALTLANKLLMENGGVADAHILVGDIQLRNQNNPAAIKHYEDARQISFDQSLMLKLVSAYQLVKNFDAARDVLVSYLANNPNDLVAQKLMADIYMVIGDAVQAIFWLETIVNRLGYNDTIILTKLARSYAALEKHDRAVQMARLAYKINPFSADATRVYGFVLMQQGENAKAALELLEKAKKLLPDDEGVATELQAARALLKTKQAPAKKG